MSSDTCAPATSGDNDAISSLLRRATISVIHEATLQDLLRCSNDAVHQILLERNALLEERITLGAPYVPYSEIDFLVPPTPLVPYLIRADSTNGYILRYRSSRQSGKRVPKDRRLKDACIQTCDPDAKTTNNTPESNNEDSEIADQENGGKKRKRSQM